ncbi:2-amino-4-hydroxy-6-hydroxymethyldihydropteridine diphosphokinase [Microbacterium sp.]|uniref:2-amino-4-hydroxy-6- hydroxymethyldihydropteridine diphosphokinase n=1 Tax=Microbacterium sp. TaxID=51671 RepID=UPI001AC76D73|nr:2-amino-4-hydroxy-6-hydroxymethyldihydropteridine diphosphokinase [Microbacterium sp.]MBN9182981.1 2-amino-4-hydroxy-6-hydroxymethyldihydropteridine diphosphokinase [Microbacterium sp.]MBN9184054.1 2-amino-4-hydroxy-6-hydroxymethyldihydropteridine diphosphokinase [Microbacterium sp.]MBN9192484.1 2-amino-4-hydroxy-6-hydroxymethyldihydropteridine diphosphokinase [Microbacterium sp.]
MSRRLAQGFSGDTAPEGAPVRAVVALGANLGDRATTLDAAVAALRRVPLVEDVRAADPIESVAVTPEGPDAAAPAYLNSVAVLSTRLAPSVLLSYLHAIEDAHGRVRRERWGDRTLDLDLIVYDDLVSDDPALTLPHPRAAERTFVLEPWLSIDPDAALPGAGRVDELLAQLRSGS